MQYEKVNIVGAMRRGKFPLRHAETVFKPEHCTPEFDEVAQLTIHGNGIVAMIGPRGTGKTQIATWAAEYFVDYVNESGGFRTDTPVFYTTAIELFTTLRADQHNPQTANRFVQYPLLVIDEIQERGETDFEDRMLTQIIDRRYANMRPTLIIGNLKPDQLASSLGRSIVDRIRETGKVIVVDGQSYRGNAQNSSTHPSAPQSRV
ncbi:MAG: ATP-binding protein [Chloroflexi bacterium]|nr:ATP-binding protein [Chloroflexota bacterium]